MTWLRARFFAAAALVLASAAAAAPAIASPRAGAASNGSVGVASLPANLQLVGHGYGHGRGMGQWGAFGYASSPYNWTWQTIIAHYYGGTALANTTVTSLPVRLVELDGASSISVSVPSGQTVLINGTNTNLASRTVTRTSADQTITASKGGDVTVAGGWSTGSTRAFTGSIVLKASSVDQVWNVVSLTQYVEGVVPREEPALWPAAALEAQAVAARSYGIAYSQRVGTICDSYYCQVYAGDPAQYPNSFSNLSNAAVTATGNQVIECGTDSACGSPTTVAFAEFSSSTGGYTAGGVFPAVVDSGDANPPGANPWHSWTTTIPTSSVASAFPSVGGLESVLVTARNGLGDYGGRVEQVEIVGTGGRTTVTGDQFAADFGLDSNWFAITNDGVAPGSDGGYWVFDHAGDVFPYGDSSGYGSMTGKTLVAPVVGAAATGDHNGYWMAASDGGIFNFGDAHFYGSAGNLPLVKPIVGMTGTGDSRGYWMVAADGGIFNYGDAHFYGSAGNLKLVKPIVAMARTADGGGYWLVASDGGVFNYGDAHFYGSAGKLRLVAPVVGIVPTSDGKGYWLVASDGGVFNYGDAPFRGSLGGGTTTGVVSVAGTPDDGGYVLLNSSGVVSVFGDASYLGDPSGSVSGAVSVVTRP